MPAEQQLDFFETLAEDLLVTQSPVKQAARARREIKDLHEGKSSSEQNRNSVHRRTAKRRISQAERIKQIIVAAGASGITREEISEQHEIRYGTVSARVSELLHGPKRNGQLIDPSFKPEVGQDGRKRKGPKEDSESQTLLFANAFLIGRPKSGSEPEQSDCT